MKKTDMLGSRLALRWAFAATALLSLFGSEARAIEELPVLITYTWVGADGNTLGGAVGSGAAGQNNFINSINADYNSAAGRNPGYLGANTVLTAPPVTTYPTWTINAVNCQLTLNGLVQFPDATFNQDTASQDLITLTLTGWLGAAGGAQLQLTKTITAADYAAAENNHGLDQNGFLPFSMTTSGLLPADVPAQETLQIYSVGRVLYKNDDTFIGAPDISSTLALLGLGTLSLLAYDWRRRMAKA